jgi:excisionase family DNA binding protein
MPEPTKHWPENTNPELMAVEDVARRINMSDSFVYNAIADGRLKHHRLGKGQGGIRVSEEQLADFLRGRSGAASRSHRNA